MAEVKALSPKHLDIMNYILANPTVKMGEVAAKYNMTLPWLSSLIHSDAFQAVLAERQEELFQGFAKPLQEQLRGVAGVAIEKLGAALTVSTDPKFVLDSTDKILNRLGWGPKSTAPRVPGQTNIQNNFYVSKEQLEQARSKMGQQPVQITDGEEEVLTIEADIATPTL